MIRSHLRPHGHPTARKEFARLHARRQWDALLAWCVDGGHNVAALTPAVDANAKAIRRQIAKTRRTLHRRGVAVPVMLESNLDV